MIRGHNEGATPIKFTYDVVGGVLIITKAQYTAVNGYSNAFAGWGQEDQAGYRPPFKTGCLPLSYSGNPGANGRISQGRSARSKGIYNV